MATPNIINVSRIEGKTAALIVTTAPQVIVTNPANSNKVIKVNFLMLSNVNGMSAGDVTVDLFRGGVAYRLVSTLTIPADASISLFDNKSLYLEEDDSLRIRAGSNGVVEAVCTYEVIS